MLAAARRAHGEHTHTKEDTMSNIFGTVVRLPSGNYRVQYYGPDGKRGRRYSAPTTFRTKGEARKFLATVHAEIITGKWLAPQDTADAAPGAAALTLAAFAEQWLAHRDLKDRTRIHYRWLLDNFIIGSPIAKLPLKSITADDVRAWYAKLDKSTPVQRSHIYGLLRTIMGDAVRDGKIAAQPCNIRGAGSVKRAKIIRPATLDELAKIIDATPERFQAMVLLASWCALRFGELTELRRKDVDPDEGLIRIRRGVYRVKGGYRVGTPKSDAGVRDVYVPDHIMPAIRAHLVDHVGPGPDALLFPAQHGGHLAPASCFRWFYKARDAAGRPDLTIHTLRHTGGTLAAQTGATLAELMGRLGHSTPQAAMRYQHVGAGRDRLLAARLAELATNGNGT
jgi:integrase